jgi:hypothetical protein
MWKMSFYQDTPFTLSLKIIKEALSVFRVLDEENVFLSEHTFQLISENNKRSIVSL